MNRRRTHRDWAAPMAVAGVAAALLAAWALPARAAAAEAGPPRAEDATPLAVVFVWSDWAAEDRPMRVRAEVPTGVTGPIEIVSGIRRPDAPPALRVAGPVGGLMEVIGPADELFLALEPGTRSLHLRSNDGRLWRVDLPAVAVQGVSVVPRSATAGDHRAAGPILHLATRNVLPGFRVFVSVRTDGSRDAPAGQRWSESEVTEKSDLYARLVQWQHRENRLEVQLLADNAAWFDDTCTYLVTVVNADGSRSESIGVTLSRDGAVRGAGRPFPARPAPIDRVREVPSLDILTATEAARQAREAGFAPMFVDLNTWREVPLDTVADEVVRAQGLRPFGRAREGEWLLLGVRRVGPEGLASEHVRRAAARGAVALGRPAPIDVGDDLGFVQVRPVPPRAQLAWQVDPLRAAAADRADAWAPERAADEVDALDSPLPEGVELPIDPASGTAHDAQAWWGADALPDAAWNEADAFSVNPDPGISILPDQPSETVLGAAVLRVVLAALSVDGVEPPGILGEAIRRVVEQFEQKVAASVQAGGADAVPVAEILAAVAGVLEVGLDDAQRKQALADWRDRFGDQPAVGAIDRNRNGLLTDDVAVWCLQWLQQQGLYDPRTQVAIIPGGSGTGAAVVAHSAKPGEWFEKLLELLLRREELAGTLPEVPATPGQPPPDQPPADQQPADQQPADSIPDGPAEEVAYTLPDGLRVPAVVGMKAGEALRVLKEHRLKATHRQGSLAQDIVTAQAPEAGWQPFVESVRITLERPVPDVTDMDLGKAVAELKKWQLRWEHGEEKAFATDVVRSQNPPPHTDARPSTIDPDKPVRLQIAVRVPNVTDRIVTEAMAALEKWDLRAGGTAGGFQQDKVLRQTPPPHRDDAPSYLPHGGTVELVLGVRVPDVARLKVPDARQRIEQWHLVPRHGDAFNEDIVLRQHPAAGEFVARGSDVHVTPGVKVPQVTGMPLGDARETLLRWDLAPETPNHLARELDTVRGQSPAPTETVVVQDGRVRRQQTRDRYVPHGSAVTLDPVVARVPQLTGREIGDARNLLEREDFRAAYDPTLFDADRVTNQRPSAGTEMARGGVVRIGAEVPVPDVVNQPVRAAEAAVLRSAGDLRPQFTLPPNAGDIVLGQRPSPGQFVNPRTTIVMTPGIPLPNVVGMELEQAAGRLRQAGLDYRVRSSSTRETENRAQHGRRVVDSQQPSPGGGLFGLGAVRAVPHGTTVDLGVVQFNYVEKVTVPNVVGMKAGWDGDLYGPAGDTLRRAGFRYESRLAHTNNQALVDTVARQDPPGGTRVPVNNRPVVLVWVYAPVDVGLPR